MTTEEMRELDAWIAEHVMRWKIFEGSGWLAAGCMDANGIKWLSGEIPYEIEFQPTVDSGQAMDVLKKCVERKMIGIAIDRNGNWEAFSVVNPEFSSKAKTPELAICLFAQGHLNFQ